MRTLVEYPIRLTVCDEGFFLEAELRPGLAVQMGGETLPEAIQALTECGTLIHCLVYDTVQALRFPAQD